MTNTKTTKIVSAILATTLSMTSFAEVTRAETVEFAYSPAELANADGAAQLNERMRDFAREVCHTTNPLSTPGQRRDCRADIENQLRDQVFGEEFAG